ncbi:MAG: hypothetical protein HY908_31085 [Myxococcales bacterium]|nr:hypothetical protein [Myxococcales bacterium]
MLDRENLLAEVTEYYCGERCMGIAGNRGGCCHLGERDWIIGPVAEADRDVLVRNLGAVLGREVTHAEVFIDFEEGRARFPERSQWQKPENYPALRVRYDAPGYPCRFYDAQKGCTVHLVRPSLCSAYQCDALRQVVSLL